MKLQKDKFRKTINENLMHAFQLQNENKKLFCKTSSVCDW